MRVRLCDWCQQPIPAPKRKTVHTQLRRFCGARCAREWFKRAPALEPRVAPATSWWTESRTREEFHRRWVEELRRMKRGRS
jgi:hypothetical protein